MKNNWKWFLGVVAVLLVLVALPFVFRSFGYGMMGGGWHRPMMGSFNTFGFMGSFMGFGMFFAWLIPLGLLALVVYGAVRLANQPDLIHKPSALPKKVCGHCDQPVQEDWKNCPYCGSDL